MMSEARSATPDGAILLPDADATGRAGRALGHALETLSGQKHAGGAVVVGLAGDLGAGKTTLARASLRALGVAGAVRSPTYTIAEPYETRIGRIWHLDLYRIADPDELEYVGLRDLVPESAACLIEWPERGGAALPEIDCVAAIARYGSGRRLRIDWSTPRGGVLGSRVLISLRRAGRSQT